MLISEEEFVEKFAQRIEATKKVSQARELVPTLERIYYTIQYFNSLNEFTLTVASRPLSEIIIADEWKDFVLPASVRLDPTDLKTNQLLVRTNIVDLNPTIPKLDKSKSNIDEINRRKKLAEYVQSFSQFNAEHYFTFVNDQSRVRSYFKSDINNNTTNLAVLRGNKSFADILPIMAVKLEGKVRCRSLDEPYVPIELVSELNCLFRSDYYNVNMDAMFTDYMSKKVIV